MNKYLDLDKAGIDIFLPPLEKAVLCAMWNSHARTARKVFNIVRHTYRTRDGVEPAYNTISSTMKRMTVTGLLVQNLDWPSGYLYTPVYANEQAFIQAMVKRVMSVMIENFPRETGMHLKQYLKVKPQ